MSSHPNDITTVEPAALISWIYSGEAVTVLDIRSAAEFGSIHVHGSYNVPLNLVAEHTEKLAPKLSNRVVLVCQSGVRAEQARQHLATVGVESAYVLNGGIDAFAIAGGDVVRGASRWSLVRHVRMVAGSLVVTGLLGAKFVSPKLRAVAGAIGAGLTFSAASNTCAMGPVLQKMPWNKSATTPTVDSAINQLPDTQN